jgi:hypothetical protein
MSSYLPRSLFDQVQPEMSDPTYRASMLPIGTYPNADGSGENLGLAMPGMIQEPMNALMRLIGTPSQPGTFTNGPDYGSNAEDMRTLLETFFGGQATKGAGAVENSAARSAGRTLYHGTRSEPFDAFDASRIGSGSGNDGFYGRGAYLTDDLDYAREMAGPNGNILGFNAAAKKPFVIDYNDFPDAMSRAAQIYPDHPLERGGFLGSDKIAGWTDALKKNGYDAVDVRYPDGLDNEFVSLDPANLSRVFSDQLPSLWGSALQPQQQYPNSLFTY